MFHVMSWLVVLALVVVWSLAAWGLHAVAVWTVSNAGALSGAVSGAVSGAASGVGAIRLPEWLAPWVPQEVSQSLTALLSGLAPVVESVLQATPALAGGVTVAIWVVWAIGSALLVLLGVGLHLFIAMWRRRGGGGSAPHSGRSLAAG